MGSADLIYGGSKGEVKKNECVCKKNSRAKMVCGKKCLNKGKSCKKTKDCKKRGGRKLKLSNKQSNDKVLQIVKIKNPDMICRNSKGEVESVTFKNLDGLDMVKINNTHVMKLHPYEAPVYVIAGKYLKVPDYLFGPLKYASETINIEQLHVESSINKHYIKTGEKLKALVTGSCASITISAITVKFVEDMVKKYNSYTKYKSRTDKQIHSEFRKEYDRRIANYLCNGTIVPKIPWYKNTLEKGMKSPWDKKTKKKMGCGKTTKATRKARSKHY
tara:strand:+ start:474 stop:1295 length:822 start_codon:yes stop_codon:yes gene_type:complete